MKGKRMNAEQLAKKFHDTYEELAPQFGYVTREESRKAWEDVPEPNKLLMIAVAGKILMAPLERPQLTADGIKCTFIQVQNKTQDRLNEKGSGILISRHEALGVITEEYTELISAVESGSQAEVEDELLDITVAGIVGLASLQTGQTDW